MEIMIKASDRKWWRAGDDWAPGEIITPQTRDEHGFLDPIFQTTTGWYYCDECWTNCYGPFETKEECASSLSDYCFWLDGPKVQ
jgi:hypothetical protein